MLALADAAGGPRLKAHDIATRMDIPVSYVPRILATLVRTGLVASTAGPDGGYELTRDPAEVSLHEVIVAVEGPAASPACVLRGGPCRWEDACAVHEPWVRAQQAMVDELAATTFAQLVAADRELQGRASAG